MTNILAISAGHNKYAPGAVGIIDEQIENRRVVKQLTKEFQSRNWKVADCTDDISKTAKDILRVVGKKHLAVPSQVDLQIHFNSGVPTANGCEVLYHPQFGDKDTAEKLSALIARVGGFKNRGAKARDDLWWLNETKTGLLIEVCFVGNEGDVGKYRTYFGDICAAVADFFAGPCVKKTKHIGRVTLLRDANVYEKPNGASTVVRTLKAGTKWNVFSTAAGFHCISTGMYMMTKDCTFEQF